MLVVNCPDGIDLKFMDERNLDVVIEDGSLTVKNKQTKEVLINLAEGEWSSFVNVHSDSMPITT